MVIAMDSFARCSTTNGHNTVAHGDLLGCDVRDNAMQSPPPRAVIFPWLYDAKGLACDESFSP